MACLDKNILLIISGSIAAYKALDMIRELRREGAEVTTILTKGGCEFITPLSVSALSENPTYTDLFSLKDETEMGHIRLSREADMIIVAPASADMLSKMATGRADDLASTVLLAADYSKTPVIVVPAMNPMMWQHPATQRNIEQCRADGIHVIEPDEGEMACGEMGKGRFPEVASLLDSIAQISAPSNALKGKRIIITGGPTHEAIDAVRYIANYSSGKQAIAIAKACARHGADVTLIHGAINEAIPCGVTSVPITSAQSMLDSVEEALPADAIICAAAVADWHVVEPSAQKLKKEQDVDALTLRLHKTPDILQHVSQHASKRPALVIGFAAETDNVIEHARDKLQRKGCDWILANDVSGGAVFGKEDTALHFITKESITDWKSSSKQDAAEQLCDAMIKHFNS